MNTDLACVATRSLDFSRGRPAVAPWVEDGGTSVHDVPDLDLRISSLCAAVQRRMSMSVQCSTVSAAMVAARTQQDHLNASVIEVMHWMRRDSRKLTLTSEKLLAHSLDSTALHCND